MDRYEMHHSPVASAILIGFASTILAYVTPFLDPSHIPPDVLTLIKTVVFSALGGGITFFVQRALRKYFPDRDEARLTLSARLKRFRRKQ